jgi:hypothetical protein
MGQRVDAHRQPVGRVAGELPRMIDWASLEHQDVYNVVAMTTSDFATP